MLGSLPYRLWGQNHPSYRRQCGAQWPGWLKMKETVYLALTLAESARGPEPYLEEESIISWQKMRKMRKITSGSKGASRRIQGAGSSACVLRGLSEGNRDLSKSVLPAPGDQSYIISSQGAKAECLLGVGSCGTEEATRRGLCMCVCMYVCVHTCV